jgi:hypothetical protein
MVLEASRGDVIYRGFGTTGMVYRVELYDDLLVFRQATSYVVSKISFKLGGLFCLFYGLVNIFVYRTKDSVLAGVLLVLAAIIFGVLAPVLYDLAKPIVFYSAPESLQRHYIQGMLPKNPHVIDMTLYTEVSVVQDGTVDGYDAFSMILRASNCRDSDDVLVMRCCDFSKMHDAAQLLASHFGLSLN